MKVKKDPAQCRGLRIACREWAHASDSEECLNAMRLGDRFDTPEYTVLELFEAGLAHQWKALVMQMSGHNYDFVGEVELILPDNSFDTELEGLLEKYGYKEAK